MTDLSQTSFACHYVSARQLADIPQDRCTEQNYQLEYWK
jgi:hypothetical protein